MVLFLPAYSPDLNDIEHDFRALKKLPMYSHFKQVCDIRLYLQTLSWKGIQ